MLTYYNKMNDEAGNLYTLGKIYFLKGDLKSALKFSNSALIKTTSQSVLWHKTQDLIMQIKDRLNE
jgi:predicted Zn-dependent protease